MKNPKILGKKLGERMYRKVYECAFDSSLVVKVEKEPNVFCNVLEFTNWNDLKNNPKCEPWLAPVHSISNDGKYLFMQRCKMIDENYKLPKRLPGWINDPHRGNFGLLNDVLVVIDYPWLIQKLVYKSVKVEW